MTRQDRVRHAEAVFADRLRQMGPGDLAIDCGANVGQISRRLARTGADVIAYEPDPVVFPYLMKAARKFPRITPHCAAVGLQAGKARLFRSPYYASDPLAESEKNTICDDALTRRREGGWQPMDADNTVTTDVVDLIAVLKAELAGRGRVAVLKLDIEGMELPILEALEQHALFDHIDLTLAELHPDRLPDRAAAMEALRTRLAARYDDTRVNLDWG